MLISDSAGKVGWVQPRVQQSAWLAVILHTRTLASYLIFHTNYVEAYGLPVTAQATSTELPLGLLVRADDMSPVTDKELYLVPLQSCLLTADAMAPASLSSRRGPRLEVCAARLSSMATPWSTAAGTSITPLTKPRVQGQHRHLLLHLVRLPLHLALPSPLHPPAALSRPVSAGELPRPSLVPPRPRAQPGPTPVPQTAQARPTAAPGRSFPRSGIKLSPTCRT